MTGRELHADVTLSGTMPSWFQARKARRAAWAARGVRDVDDRRVVTP